jgi:hypothetical protein
VTGVDGFGFDITHPHPRILMHNRPHRSRQYIESQDPGYGESGSESARAIC